jgi:transmembrane sensor
MSQEFMDEMIRKIAEGDYTPGELSAFLQQLDKLSDDAYARMFNEIYAKQYGTAPGEIDPQFKARLEAKLDSLQAAGVVKLSSARRAVRWAVAAMLLVIAGTGAYIISRRNEKPVIPAAQYKGDVNPGHIGAVLHLSNGATIALDSTQDGTVARQGNISAVKVNGQLSYTGSNEEVLYNDVTTEKGRQWQLTLPDDTKVWLNAASSIHYPLTFTGPERIVEITGEAYFEVAHNARQPFKVKAGGQLITDMGTSFNVNVYTDEPVFRTTVTEGMVSIGNINLKGGKQAVIENGRVSVTDANTEQALAWKNGFFSFDKADIYTVMRQLARWYNVEIKFEGKPGITPFRGEIGRSLTLAQVLKGLEQIHVHFRIEEDKRIVILP